ncbi:MAG: D-glycero-beta-D-manno-heptose-7-phosphate kinase [Alphaproteobacteria bacterium]|nr:D-glycero-beta-D-manno-heptose-7-phosphate kinase [Alphaproteobacteria bacterium]
MHGAISTEDQLARVVSAMKGVSVAVIGDIMLDRFVYGEVERISPEAPVPILSVRRENRMLGGAGNVLSNLAGLGAAPVVVAVVGDDEEATTVRTLAKSFGANPDGLITEPGRPTTVKTRYLAGHQHLLRSDYEKNGPVPAGTEAAIIENSIDAIARSRAVVLSDYGKGVLTSAVLRAVIDTARERGIPCLVDPKGADYRRYERADIVTPNRKELALATGGMPTETDADIAAAAERILRDCGIGTVVATRSQDGMSIVGRHGEPIHIRANAREVFDVSGAGDTVIATLAAALAVGANLADGGALANRAGGIVVGKVGTAPIRANELAAALNDESACSASPRQARLYDWEQAAETAERWQARGLKVGFTNGCFDLLHAGHVRYLGAARRRCDRLILGLNCDASVRRLKGKTRPVNDERARAEVVGSLGSVDMVVLFGETESENDMPLEILARIRPDIHFKGGDYRIEDLPEAEVVLSWGGEVQILDLIPGRSTTSILEKVKS